MTAFSDCVKSLKTNTIGLTQHQHRTDRRTDGQFKCRIAIAPQIKSFSLSDESQLSEITLNYNMSWKTNGWMLTSRS